MMKKTVLTILMLAIATVSYSEETTINDSTCSGSYSCVDPSTWNYGGTTNCGCGDRVVDGSTICVSGAVYFKKAGSVIYPGECLSSGDPDHCTNGVQDGDETGIDCGGSCSTGCGDGCPDGWSGPYLNIATGELECHKTMPPNSYGDCPPGYEHINDGCRAKSGPIPMAPGTPAPPDPDPNPWPGPVSSSSDSSSSVSDNGDGTSTKTTTTTNTTTNSDNSTTVSNSTTTQIIDNSTGDVISQTTVNNYPPGEGDNADVVAAVNNARIAITGKLDTANDHLANIEQNTSDLITETNNEDVQIESDLDVAIGQSMSDIDSAYSDLANEVISDAGNGKTFPVSESMTSTVENVFPTHQGCTTGYVMDIQGHEFVIECQYFDMTQILLEWIFSLLTLFALYQIVFKPIGSN